MVKILRGQDILRLNFGGSHNLQQLPYGKQLLSSGSLFIADLISSLERILLESSSTKWKVFVKTASLSIPKALSTKSRHSSFPKSWRLSPSASLLQISNKSLTTPSILRVLAEKIPRRNKRRCFAIIGTCFLHDVSTWNEMLSGNATNPRDWTLVTAPHKKIGQLFLTT